MIDAHPRSNTASAARPSAEKENINLNKCVNRAYGAGVAEGLCGIGVWLSIF